MFSRPLLEIATLTTLAMGVLAGIWAGCAAPHATGSAGNGFVPQPIELPSQPPAAVGGGVAPPPPSGPIVEDEPVVLSMTNNNNADGGASPAILPLSWSVTFGHTRPFAEAMHLATDARRTFDRAAWSITASTDGGAPAPKQFERASSLLDQSSRLYAAAYHAPNASMNNRIDTLHDAADMILAWSRKLDEAGLARAPATYRSDPSVALTFEDVANGPAKRWREEGIALLHLCIELARKNNIDTNASRGCSSMRHSYARVISRTAGSGSEPGARNETARPAGPSFSPPPRAADGGTSATGCACDPGDPLCSASMSGWCRPK